MLQDNDSPILLTPVAALCIFAAGALMGISDDDYKAALIAEERAKEISACEKAKQEAGKYAYIVAHALSRTTTITVDDKVAATCSVFRSRS